MRPRILTAALVLAASLFATWVAPAAAFEPSAWLRAGEKMCIVYPNSPLRNCPQTDCTVMAWMPVSTSSNSGGGYVTSVISRPWAVGLGSAPWCEINWKGIVGWTGCGGLARRWRRFRSLLQTQPDCEGATSMLRRRPGRSFGGQRCPSPAILHRWH